MAGGPGQVYFPGGTTNPTTKKTQPYNLGELRRLWEHEGGSVSTGVIAAAVAMAESSGDQHAIGGPNSDGSFDYGLWQINHKAHPEYDIQRLVDDPAYNARAAIAISGHGKTFTPWSTYNNGAYKDHLQTKDSKTVDSITGVVTAPIDAALAIPKFLGKLGVIFSGGFWLRVGLLLAGAAAIVGGVVLIGKQYSVGSVLKGMKS